MASLVGTRLELTVGPVAHGGHCVARADGRVVFVRHTLPGEQVVAVVTEGDTESRYLRADAVDVLLAAADRVEPPCPYAGPGLCGGCSWQHVSLAGQRELKATVVREAFERFAHLDVSVVVEAVPGDERGLGWRTRVGYSVDAGGQAGFRRHRSREVVPVEGCLIAHPAVESVGVTQQVWAGFAGVDVVASATSGERVVIADALRAHAAVPALDPAVEVLVRRRGGRGRPAPAGAAYVTERAVGRSWRVRADAFWQVHPGAADTLASAVVDLLRPRPGEHVLDLYSGVGLMAAALAPHVGPGGRVVGVEVDTAAVESARENLADLPAVTVVRGDVAKVLSFARPDEVGLVVLDPPRDGAGRAVMERIVSVVRPRAIAYVACDPVALARDVSYALPHGYTLAALRAFDCFPMTHHVECVATLVKTA